MKKNSFVVILCLLLLSSSLMAASRVDSVLSTSSDEQLEKILTVQEQIKLNEDQIKLMVNEIEIAEKNQKGRHLMVKVRNIAGITTGVSIGTMFAGFFIVLGQVKMKSAIGQFLGMGSVFSVPVIAVSGIIAGASALAVMLTKDEAKELKMALKELQKLLHTRKSELKKEIKILCEQDPRHVLCY